MPPKRACLIPAGPPTSNKRRSSRNDRTAPSRPLESRCPRMRAPSDRNLPTSEDELAVNTEDDSAVKAEDEPVVKVEDELAVKTENEPNRNAAAVNANSNTAAALAPASPPIATVAAEPCPGRTSAEVKGLLKAILDRYDNFLREEAQMMAELAKLLDTVEE